MESGEQARGRPVWRRGTAALLDSSATWGVSIKGSGGMLPPDTTFPFVWREPLGEIVATGETHNVHKLKCKQNLNNLYGSWLLLPTGGKLKCHTGLAQLRVNSAWWKGWLQVSSEWYVFAFNLMVSALLIFSRLEFKGSETLCIQLVS